MPAKLVKTSRSKLAVPLAYISKEIIENGVFPETLKLARDEPSHKKGVTPDCTSYGLVSILPILSNFFQKIIDSRIVTFWKMKGH